MRLLRLMALFMAGPCLISPSMAQIPPNVLFPGSVFASHARGSGAWCAVDPGSSEFQRNTATGAAKISFPDVTYYHSSIAPQSFLLTGQAILSFTNASSGTIAFVVNHGAPRGGPVFGDRLAAWLRWILGFDYAANFSCSMSIA